jgi:hypothetical protein
MSVDLNVVREVMYLRTGEVHPGDEVRVMRLERKLSDWYRDVCKEPGSEKPAREEMLADLSQVENACEGYWCEGEKCVSDRTHWVMHSSKTLCWDCSHDPCACSPPLVWDESERAYYGFFLSCDGKTKENIWMSEPKSDLALISFKRKEKKQRENETKRKEEEECADNQQTAQKEGFCCHHHAKRLKVKAGEASQKKLAKRDGPDNCVHCNEDPCVFIQIKSRLCENDTIYYDEEEYENNPAAYNSGRRKRAYQYAAFVLWEGINYRRPHYTCVENGVRALSPP